MIRRVAIVGAGAIGSAYGFLLARAGLPVVLVDTWQDHVDAILRDGLRVEGSDQPPPELAATTDPGSARDADAVFILVKSFATEAAAHSLAGTLDPDAIVVTLQNGIGNDRLLAGILGGDRVVQGSTTVGAQVLGPGHIAIVPGTLQGSSLTSLGCPPSPAAAAATRSLAGALEAAGLPAEVLDDVRAVVWRKLAMAAVIGPLCATLGWDVSRVIADPDATALLHRGFGEVLAVARHGGVEIDPAELWEHAIATYTSIGPHPPSLAVDVARGRRTEIDGQLGEVLRRATEAGLDTPVARVLTAAVRGLTGDAPRGS
jgi:2-dehydropantoate 2-reductase